ncbi:hypothetical protein ACFLT5_03230 [Chloroflexota bacterium]
MPGLYLLDVGINASIRTRAMDVIVHYPAFWVVNSGKHSLDRRPDRPGLVLCNDVSWKQVSDLEGRVR